MQEKSKEGPGVLQREPVVESGVCKQPRRVAKEKKNSTLTRHLLKRVRAARHQRCDLLHHIKCVLLVCFLCEVAVGGGPERKKKASLRRGVAYVEVKEKKTRRRCGKDKNSHVVDRRVTFLFPLHHGVPVSFVSSVPVQIKTAKTK